MKKSNEQAENKPCTMYAEISQSKKPHPNQAVDIIEISKRTPTTFYGAFCRIEETHGKLAAEVFSNNIQHSGKLLIGSELYVLL